MQPNATKFTTNKEKILLSGVYKDLTKFAEDTDSHLIGEELEDSLKGPKEDIIVSRHSIIRQTTSIHQLSENSMKFQKMTGQPKNPWLVTRAPHSTIPQVHGQN